MPNDENTVPVRSDAGKCDTPSYQIHQGNALAVLQYLDPGDAQCCVTSPPYWGLRDYGDPGQDWPSVEFTMSLGGLDVPVSIPAMTAPLGLEKTPIAFVGHLVAIFREVRRVLADDGVLWLNIGDTFNSSPSNQRGTSKKSTDALNAIGRQNRAIVGMKPKDLVGIPWLLAYALRSDGWYLRSDVIWHKRNPMPESVTDRPTKGHEYVFLLAKSDRYFYDADALREPWNEANQRRVAREAINGMTGDYAPMPDELGARTGSRTTDGLGTQKGRFLEAMNRGKNARTVWSISSKGYAGAHHAVMPPELARRCVVSASRPGDVVLDPFAGAATAGKVAIEQGRRFLGIELMAENVERCRERCESARVKSGLVTADDALPGQQLGLLA